MQDFVGWEVGDNRARVGGWKLFVVLQGSVKAYVACKNPSRTSGDADARLVENSVQTLRLLIVLDVFPRVCQTRQVPVSPRLQSSKVHGTAWYYQVLRSLPKV